MTSLANPYIHRLPVTIYASNRPTALLAVEFLSSVIAVKDFRFTRTLASILATETIDR